MKKHVENLKDWVFAPFGRAWLFALVFSAFSLSVIADLASTYHLLSQENWNLEIEQNVFSRFIFAKFGFSGGALLILIGELLLIFFVVLPLFWRRTKPGARMFARQISIVCLLGLALYFSLIALENPGSCIQGALLLAISSCQLQLNH